jgi:chemotaxis family two-component system sensor kinase Cph1
MGVQSSLTVSIVVGGRLWGMIACHHPTPRRVDPATRAVCEVIGQTFASQITLADGQCRFAVPLVFPQTPGELRCRNRNDPDRSSTSSTFRAPNSSAFRCGRLDRTTQRCGFLPWNHRERRTAPCRGVPKMRNLASRGIASSRKLSELVPAAVCFANLASGALYVGLDESAADYLLFSRRELVETVIWAGNPNTAVTADEHDKLHPRASFEAWHETVCGRSRPWTETELGTASTLREQLLRLRVRKNSASERRSATRNRGAQESTGGGATGKSSSRNQRIGPRATFWQT